MKCRSIGFSITLTRSFNRGAEELLDRLLILYQLPDGRRVDALLKRNHGIQVVDLRRKGQGEALCVMPFPHDPEAPEAPRGPGGTGPSEREEGLCGWSLAASRSNLEEHHRCGRKGSYAETTCNKGGQSAANLER